LNYKHSFLLLVSVARLETRGRGQVFNGRAADGTCRRHPASTAPGGFGTDDAPADCLWALREGAVEPVVLLVPVSHEWQEGKVPVKFHEKVK
jgi:hypothetical protein